MTKRMKAWLYKSLSDNDDTSAIEGKGVIIVASKEQVIHLAEFLQKVSNYLKANDYCHMHFRDYFPKWEKNHYIDVEVNVEK